MVGRSYLTIKMHIAKLFCVTKYLPSYRVASRPEALDFYLIKDGLRIVTVIRGTREDEVVWIKRF